MRNRLLGALTILGAAALLSAPARAVTYYGAIVNSDQVPATANGGQGSQSPGMGWASIELADDEQSLTYELHLSDLLRPAGDPNAGQPDEAFAAHFHLGAPGVEGPVQKTIWSGTNYDIVADKVFTGTWAAGDASQPFTAGQLANLKAGDLYINVHTRLYPGGAVRGQVTPGAIPEPGTMALLASGLLPLAAAFRRRR